MPEFNELGILSQLAPRNDALRRAANIPQLDPVRAAFAGPDDPRMSPEETAAARRSAILGGGFAGLLAAGQGANPLEVLGQAGIASLNTRLAINDAYEPPAARELKTQVIEVLGEDGMLHRLLIDKQTGTTIQDLGVSELPDDDPEFGQPIKVQLPGGDVVLAVFDKKHGVLKDVNTGQVLVNAVPFQAPQRGVAMNIEDKATGNKYVIMVDPTTNEQIGPPRFRGAPDADGDEQEDAITITTMRRRLNEVEDIYSSRGYTAFGLKDVYTEKSDLVRGFLTSEDFKQAKPAQDFIVSAVLKAIQGSRPSDFDLKMYLNFLVPRVGDTSENVQQKISRIRQMVQDYEQNPASAFEKTLNRAKGGGADGTFYDEFDLDGD